jgi:hypothetical protein
MKPNTPESIHSNIMDHRAALFSASTNRITPNVATGEEVWSLNGSAFGASRRRTDTDRQRLVAILDEAIRITFEISPLHEANAPASS